DMAAIEPYLGKLKGEVGMGVFDDQGITGEIHLQASRKDADLIHRIVLGTYDGSDLSSIGDASRIGVAVGVPSGMQLDKQLCGKPLTAVVEQRGAVPIPPGAKDHIVHTVLSPIFFPA